MAWSAADKLWVAWRRLETRAWWWIASNDQIMVVLAKYGLVSSRQTVSGMAETGDKSLVVDVGWLCGSWEMVSRWY